MKKYRGAQLLPGFVAHVADDVQPETIEALKEMGRVLLAMGNKTAIEALHKQIQRIAFDANLFDQGLADYPYAEACSKKKKKLIAAIEALGGTFQPHVTKRDKPSPNAGRKKAPPNV